MALTTHFIGVHTVLGAFIAGVLIGESPILSKHIDEQLRGLILAFFMPVFFGIAGLSADLTVLKQPALLLMTLGLIAIASFGKFAGAFIGGEIGGLTRREAFALACGMNARGSTEVIIATIGLSMGALSQDLFTMIVTMAVATTMAMPPMLRWALRRVPMRKAEKQRLEGEEFETRGFVSNLERLLLAVDQSPNGKFAVALAGLLAGPRRIPVTVLSLSERSKSSPSDKPDKPLAGSHLDATIKAAADDSKPSQKGADETAPADVTILKHDAPTDEAVAKEAKKGYDLLLVGIDKTRSKGSFDEGVGRIASAFEGPLAIVAGHADRLSEPQRSPAHILVPVTGSEVSRRAADVAMAIASGCDCPVTALYVATSGANNGHKGRVFRARRQEQAIMKDMVELADHYDVTAKTAVRSDLAPRDAILEQANKGAHDLIVMGVSRRPGDKLFFGDTAAAVLEKAPASIVFIAS
jgi:K+:H+ antiporter